MINKAIIDQVLDFFEKFDGSEKKSKTRKACDDQNKCQHIFFISPDMPNPVPCKHIFTACRL